MRSIDHRTRCGPEPSATPARLGRPGLASLRAALNPASVNFLYFVAKNDGSHQFSRTLEQHQKAVRFYQGGGRESQDQDRATPAMSQKALNGRPHQVEGS